MKDEYYEKNKESILKRRKERYENNKEKEKEYYKKNKEDILKRRKEYKQNNPEIEKNYYIKNRETILNKRKEYRKNNQEKIRCHWKEYYEKNKEKRKQYHENNREVLTSKRREYGKKNQKKTMIRDSIRRAKKKNIEHAITLDDIIIPKKCPVLEIVLEYGHENKGNSPSLDRLDSKEGYTKDNINIISFRANAIKSDATFEEFEAIYKWWKAELKKRKKKPCPNTTSE